MEGLFNTPTVSNQPFSLSLHDEGSQKKLIEDVMNKTDRYENAMQGFFGNFNEWYNSWRVTSTDGGKKEARGLFDSKSGETHRATETLATTWFRMLTSQDPYFECIANGLDQFGQEINDEELYGIEKLLLKQLEVMKYKKKLLCNLRSLSLFGTQIFEEPWVTKRDYNGKIVFEGTDFVPRSLLATGFDPFVYDIELSDYIYSVDYITTQQIRKLMNSDPDLWNVEKLSTYLNENKEGESAKKEGSVYNQILKRKQRAGYRITDTNIREHINYHGRIDTDNPIVAHYWESLQRQDNPDDFDFTIGILDGEVMSKFHLTQYGDWHSKYKIANYKQFELEPIAYGVGKIGAKQQKELDVIMSRAQNILMFALYSMWKVGKYAGLKQNSLTIKPMNIITLEDINQLEPLRPDLGALVNAANMMAIGREDFRATTGATSNLQAITTQSTATEASITQAESIRGAGVMAEIIGETFVRDHIEQMHINNCNYLDTNIWVSTSGTNRFKNYNKNMLPTSLGFETRVTTDKNFRPERLKNLLQAMQIATSIRNQLPPDSNVMTPLLQEIFREMGINPRRLREPKTMQEQLADQMKQQAMQGNAGNEVQGEMANQDSGNGVSNMPNPVGMIPNSPLG